MSDVTVLVKTATAESVRRQRPAALLIVVFVGVVLTCNGLVGAGVSRYARSVEYKSALNLIELSSVSTSARREIDDQGLREIGRIEGVTGAYPWTQVDLSLADSSDWPDAALNPGALWATPDVPGLIPATVAGAIPAAGLRDDQIALPHSVPGGTLDRLLGKRVTMDFTQVTGVGQGRAAQRSFTVVAIIDNAVPGEAGPTPSYISVTALQDLMRASGAAGPVGSRGLAYRSAYVRVTDPSTVPRVQRELAQQGYAVSSVATQLKSLRGLFRVLSLAGWFFGALLALVCLAVGGFIGSLWVQQRTREIGLLKALGWSRQRILGAVVAQLGAVGAMAAVVGVLVGVAGSLVSTAIVAVRHIDVLAVDPWRVPSVAVLLLTLVLVPACVIAGGLRSAVRAVNVDPDDALRDL